MIYAIVTLLWIVLIGFAYWLTMHPNRIAAMVYNKFLELKDEYGIRV